MTLQYLTFSADDDGGDRGCWEAMASTSRSELAAVRAEVAQVLLEPTEPQIQVALEALV